MLLMPLFLVSLLLLVGGNGVEGGNCGKTYSLNGATQRDSNVCVCSGTNNEILEHCNGIADTFNERL